MGKHSNAIINIILKIFIHTFILQYNYVNYKYEYSNN